MHRVLGQTKEGLSYAHLHIHLNVDEWWLTSSMPQQRFKLQMLLNCAVIQEKVIFDRIVIALKFVEVNWFLFTDILANLITNSIHA